MHHKIIPLLFFLFILLAPATTESAILQLEGHLGKEEVQEARKTVQSVKSEDGKQLVIVLDSSSGDLMEVLKLAKEIYALKAEKQTELTVYIDQSAVGPAAVIPFLADKLYISFFVSWGDIPLGSETTVPTNLLRNTVRSLIASNHPHYRKLILMATAMADPTARVVDDGGWKLSKEPGAGEVSSDQETLVVNHNQLQALGLTTGVLSPSQFKSRFAAPSDQSDLAPADQVPKEMLSQAQKDLQAHITFKTEEPNSIGLIQINDKKTQISQATWIYVKNALEYYKKNPPAFVILELNTPGGEVFAAQKISDALKELDTQFDIPVVAFINNWAISAGAMLAYSARFIAVTKDASMGAAEPVMIGEGGKMETASEKVNSALRADFANRARFFDRNPDVAEAMVDKDIILVMRHGRIVKLDNEEQIRKTGLDPDEVITSKGKLLTLNTEEMIELGVADILLKPAKTALITEEERTKGKWPADKMLLFQQPFFKEIPNATVDLYKMDWKTQLLTILSNPMVSSILFMGMLLGFYVEINSPGFGIPGSIGLLCLFLISLSSYALEVADILEIVLLLVGLIFIVLDLFLIPTFGLLGVVGVIFFLIGLFGMMLPGIGSVSYEFDTQTFNAAGEVFIERLAYLSGSLVVGLILIALMGRYVMPTFSGFQRFVLVGREETKEDGYVAGADVSTLPEPGTKGEVLATLRPSGKILIEDQIFDAIAFGEFIEKGKPIVVKRLDGSVIIVDEVKGKD